MCLYDKERNWVNIVTIRPYGGGDTAPLSSALAAGPARSDLYVGHNGSCEARASTLAVHLNGCNERRSGR